MWQRTWERKVTPPLSWAAPSPSLLSPHPQRHCSPFAKAGAAETAPGVLVGSAGPRLPPSRFSLGLFSPLGTDPALPGGSFHLQGKGFWGQTEWSLFMSQPPHKHQCLRSVGGGDTGSTEPGRELGAQWAGHPRGGSEVKSDFGFDLQAGGQWGQMARDPEVSPPGFWW